MTSVTTIFSNSNQTVFNVIENMVKIISEKFSPEKIILFGSYAHGKPAPESDVDLLVVMEHEKSALETSSEISLSVRHTIPIDIIVRSPQRIKERLEQGDYFVQSIIEQGKVLYERPC